MTWTVFLLVGPWLLLIPAMMLLWRRGVLDQADGQEMTRDGLSIIIPARNESSNLPNLLSDLARQTCRAGEILVVDDASTDGTDAVTQARGLPCLVLKKDEKPSGWNGKSYACHRGVQQARGRELLFLDADVRLAPDAVARFLKQVDMEPDAVHGLQPWHCPVRLRESLSACLNILVLSGTGAFLPFRTVSKGVFGPCLWMTRKTYQDMGGHEAIREAGLENIAMGARLAELGIRLRSWQGRPAIGYRMYSGAWREQNQGWVKSLVYGGESSGPVVLFLVSAWIAGSLAAFGNLFMPLLVPVNPIWGILGYGAWSFLMAHQMRKAGQFPWWTWACYPIPMGYLLWIQFEAMRRKVFRKPVLWRGRDLAT